MVILRSLTGIVLLALVVPLLVHESFAQNCGPEGGGQSCASPNCCSEFSFCNVGEDYCGAGCQPAYGNCNGGTPTTPAGDCGAGVGGVASEDQYTSIFPFPPRNALYTYSAFIEATGLYSEFANTGDCSTRRREIAAFFANIHHETGGLAFVEETNPSGDYCDPTNGYACAAGKRYYGRGPVQLSWNYNYKQCGDAIGVDLLNNPELVATDGVISFKTAMWFWQTAQSPKPSCHDVMTGLWSPSAADAAGGRQPGFGMTINIINGGKECGATPENTSGAESRIILFKQICGNLGVDTGSNLLCSSMTPY